MKPLVKLLSASMPRAGHHAIEMVMKGLFHERFAYCEFYTITGCCKMIPCAKTGEHAAAGALVFMQKTHGPRHSPAYLQFSLGMEAAYSNGFFRKWCALKNDRVLARVPTSNS